MITLLISFFQSNENPDFEGWAVFVMTEMLVELVACIILAVVYVF